MVEKITPAEAIRLLDAGKAQAVDVREPDEFAVGHIPGAKLLPRHRAARLQERTQSCRQDQNGGQVPWIRKNCLLRSRAA